MYKVRPIFDLPDKVDVPTTMYESSPFYKLNSTTDKLCGSSNGQAMDVEGIKQRQNEIINNLKKMKQDLEKHEIKPMKTNQTKRSVASIDCKLPATDFVIKCNPRNSPTFLLNLKNILKKEGIYIGLQAYVHSTVKDIDTSLLSLYNDDDNGKNKFKFSILFKEGIDNFELMVSPLRQTAIKGSTNIARFICRFFRQYLVDLYSEDGGDKCVLFTSEIDYWLDLCDIGDVKDAAKQIIKRLSNNEWLCDQFTLADIICLFYITSSNVEQDNKIIMSWKQRVNDLTGKNETNIENKNIQCIDKSEDQENDVQNVVDEVIERQLVESCLRELNIKYSILDHPPVLTVPEMMKFIGDLKGHKMKNLMIKDKKKKTIYMLSTVHDTQVNLNSLARQIGAKELRLSDESVLRRLHLTGGDVNPFALLHDKGSDETITYLLDDRVKEGGDSKQVYVNFHPMVNSATLNLSLADFLRFLTRVKHQPIWVKF